jgi:hypothetical protein
MSRQWMPLDNAALIFPAIRRSTWVNTFRMAVTMPDDIDPVLLQRAVNELRPRFPSIYVRLGAGLFWYFLEAVREPPRVRPDYAYPLTHMGGGELRVCCFRVLYYKRRMAVEFFHSLTDGTGGMIFIKTLAARYIDLRYGVRVPPEKGVLDIGKPPLPSELEDSFQRCSGEFAMSRAEENAWRLRGTPEPAGFLHQITGLADTEDLVRAAHAHNATVTAFVCAVMAQAIIGMQAEEVPLKRQKPVKITIPVNLRNLFGGDTLRNFALVINPGVDPRLGSYTLDELCREFTHQMAVEITPQKMAARVAANVKPQNKAAMRLAPLFLKNMAMRMIYTFVGESKGCLNISNLGRVELPEAMKPYIRRFEFIIGVQYSYPNNCSIASCGEVTCISMIRNIEEPELERRFFSSLVELGVPIEIESNLKREA